MVEELHSALLEHFTEPQLNRLKKHLSTYVNETELLYELLGYAELQKYEDILDDVKNSRFGFYSSVYAKQLARKHQYYEQLQNPPKVKDSNLPCKSCGQLKTVIFEMQTRAADEGSTYEIRCYNPSCMAIRKTDNF